MEDANTEKNNTEKLSAMTTTSWSPVSGAIKYPALLKLI
jgi:hypothetical protein